MTDEEMVKAMEICKDKEMPCDDCPLVEYGDCEEISRQYFYDRFNQLKSENAALKERLNKAVELPVPLGAFAICIRKISVWDGVPPKKHFKWVLAEELFTIDDIPNTGRLWFPNTEEGRKQAEERLKELQGD